MILCSDTSLPPRSIINDRSDACQAILCGGLDPGGEGEHALAGKAVLSPSRGMAQHWDERRVAADARAVQGIIPQAAPIVVTHPWCVANEVRISFHRYRR